MQQTENYKLNLIETSDPFSPNPLNANTQVFDQVMAAVASEQHLFKLAEVERTEGGGPMSVDLSGVDMTQYNALVMIGQMGYGSAEVLIINDNAARMQVLNHPQGGYGDSYANSFVMFLLAPGWGYVHVFSRFVGINNQRNGSVDGDYSGRVDVKWEDLRTLNFPGTFKVGSRLQALGVKF